MNFEQLYINFYESLMVENKKLTDKKMYKNILRTLKKLAFFQKIKRLDTNVRLESLQEDIALIKNESKGNIPKEYEILMNIFKDKITRIYLYLQLTDFLKELKELLVDLNDPKDMKIYEVQIKESLQESIYPIEPSNKVVELKEFIRYKTSQIPESELVEAQETQTR